MINKPDAMSRLFHSLKEKYQYYLDRLTPHTTIRWVIALITFFFFALRVLLKGYYLVAYEVLAYYTHIFLLFLTPAIEPVLPSKADDEFRPFLRLLPEFKFWLSFVRATVIGTICTFFEFLDIPFYWQLLAIQAIVMFLLVLYTQIKYMIKYRSIPFTVGKPRMAGNENTGKVVVG